MCLTSGNLQLKATTPQCSASVVLLGKDPCETLAASSSIDYSTIEESGFGNSEKKEISNSF